jgi:serpin B
MVVPAALMLVVLLSGCTEVLPSKEPDSTPTPVPPGVMLDENGWTSQGVQQIVNANNRFALQLYSRLKELPEQDNVFFSPYSISIALAMTYEGARGDTAKAMQSVLHLPDDANLRRPNIARIINEINRPDKNYVLHTANALWPRIDFKLLEEYQDTVERYYGGDITPLDYVRNPSEAASTINNWVKEKTNGKIKELIKAGSISSDTVLILTNAVYFKGSWLVPFDSKNTQQADFTTHKGEVVKVPMMKQEGEFNYAKTAEVQLLEMLYDGNELSMLVILPVDNNLEKIEAMLSVEKLNEWRGMLAKRRVLVYMPKFKLKTTYSLEKTLSDMGMQNAFTQRADFSGINGEGSIYINSVLHKAFVEVNEEGTEAAAATGIGVVVSVPPTFKADHPFIFIIQQRDTGNILFMGRVVDPSS